MPKLPSLTLYRFARSELAALLVFIACVFIFMQVTSRSSAKSFDNGEVPGAHFFVAVGQADAAQPLKLLPFAEAMASDHAFVFSQRDWKTHTGEYDISEYHVLEQTDSGTLIETIQRDDDYTFTSRYRVNGRQITPLCHRTLGPGHGFAGFLLAMVFCALLFPFLRWYTRHDTPPTTLPVATIGPTKTPQNLLPTVRSLWKPLIGAGVVTFFLAQPFIGFMLVPMMFILIPWTLHSLWVIATKPPQRRRQQTLLGIWWISVALIIGIHYVRATVTRSNAQQVVDAVIAYHKAHGTYPDSSDAIGYPKDKLHDMIGVGGYSMSDGKPAFYYATPYLIYETDHYDFVKNEWRHVGD